jgi:hypothetical protein
VRRTQQQQQALERGRMISRLRQHRQEVVDATRELEVGVFGLDVSFVC